MGMGWNLLGGALAGLGNGMVQNADAEQKRVAAEALAMKEQAMARLTSDLAVQRDQATYDRGAPERKFKQELDTKKLEQDKTYQDAIIADKGLQRTLTDERNKAMAERDMARAEAAAMKAGAGAGKREQDLSQRELEMLKDFNQRMRDAEKDPTRGPAEAQKIKLEMIDHFGDRSFKFNTDKDGNPTSIILKDRLGNSMTFPNYEAALKAGAVDAQMQAVYEKITQTKKPKADEAKKSDSAASSGQGVIEMAARAKSALGGNLRPEEQAFIDKADAAKSAKEKALAEAKQAEWRKKQQNFDRRMFSLSDLVTSDSLYSQNYGNR